MVVDLLAVAPFTVVVHVAADQHATEVVVDDERGRGALTARRIGGRPVRNVLRRAGVWAPRSAKRSGQLLSRSGTRSGCDFVDEEASDGGGHDRDR